VIRDLQANPTRSGGILRATLARATVTIELDADGQIIHHTATPIIEGLNPPVKPAVEGVGPAFDPLRLLTDAQRATVAERRAVCAGCDQNGGLTALTVKCNGCGCGCAGLSLVSGTCKLGRWP